MLFLNNKPLTVKHFPDGTQMLLDINIPQGERIDIKWLYENDSELLTLIYLKRHIDNSISKRIDVYLTMPYIPNARMDRTKNISEVFTLKYFCEVINSLNFKNVTVFDPHSNVSTALLNNCTVLNSFILLKSVLNIIDNLMGPERSLWAQTLVFYFPDEGAYKRYKDIVGNNCDIIIGKKSRDWKTGKILGLDVYDGQGEKKLKGKALKGKIIVMMDDIVSYGGTLAYSADKLKKLGADYIFAVVSHTENSVLDKKNGTLLKRLNKGIVNHLFTTDSIFTGNDKNISIAVSFK